MGDIGADWDNLRFMKRAAKLFGADYARSVLAAGRFQLPFATQAAMMGGNVREDNLYINKDRLAASNAEPVRKIG